MAHGKWSEVEARGVLEAWRRSGLPLERFAKQRGLVSQRLRWWRKKLNRAEVTVRRRTPGEQRRGRGESRACHASETISGSKS